MATFSHNVYIFLYLPNTHINTSGNSYKNKLPLTWACLSYCFSHSTVSCEHRPYRYIFLKFFLISYSNSTELFHNLRAQRRVHLFKMHDSWCEKWNLYKKFHGVLLGLPVWPFWECCSDTGYIKRYTQSLCLKTVITDAALQFPIL